MVMSDQRLHDMEDAIESESRLGSAPRTAVVARAVTLPAVFVRG